MLHPRTSTPTGLVLVLLALNLVFPANAIVLPPPPPDADPGFTSPLFEGWNLGPIAFQSDGRMLVVAAGLSTNRTALDPIIRLRQDGSIDPTFRFTGIESGGINAILVLPDDTVLIGGWFTFKDGTTNRMGILRLNADGSFDRSFPAFANVNGGIDSLALDSEGRICVGGTFSAQIRSLASPVLLSRNSLVRLLPGGTLDPTFGSERVGGQRNVRLDGSIRQVVPLSDGRLLLWGWFNRVYDTPRPGLAILKADGALDPDFDPARVDGLGDIEVMPGNRLLLAGGQLGYAGQPTPGMVRLLPDGSPDPDFQRLKDSLVWFPSITLDRDGNLLVFGEAPLRSEQRLFRFFPDGELDSSFNSPTSAATRLFRIDRAPSGTLHRTMVSATSSSLQGSLFRIERVLDVPTTSFAPELRSAPAPLSLELGQPAVLEIETTAHPRPSYQWQHAGTNIANATNRLLHLPSLRASDAGEYRLIVKNSVGTLTSPALVLSVKAPETAPGSIQLAFNPGVIVPWEVQAIEALEDGRFMVCGRFTHIQGQRRPGLALLGPDGKLDASFVPDTREFSSVQSAKPSISGGWWITGLVGSMTRVIRLRSDGSRDPAFTPTPLPSSPPNFLTAPAPNGGVYIARESGGIVRLNPDGSTPALFFVTVTAPAHLQTTTEDRIIILGGFTNQTGLSAMRIVRVLPNGTFDPSFRSSLEFGESIPSALIPLPDGRVLVLDSQTPRPELRLLRLNADGSLDRAFRPELNPTNQINHVLPLRSGSLLIASVDNPTAEFPNVTLERLHPDGTLDPGFRFHRDGAGWVIPFAEARDGSVLASLTSSTTPSGLVAINAGPSAPIAPSVLGWPTLQSLPSGADLVLAPRLRGSPQPQVQWFKDGIALSGETNAALIRPNVRANAAGRYHLTAVNPSGAITTEPVEVQVEDISNIPGTVDPDFFSGNGPNGPVNTMLEFPDGKWLIAGDFTSIDGEPRPRFARLNPDGSLDPTFNPTAGPDYEIITTARLPDGTLLLGGSFNSFGAARRSGLASLAPTGVLLPTVWDTPSRVTALHVSADGRILVGMEGVVASYSTNGSPIATSQRYFDGEPSGIAVQTNGQIIVVGNLVGDEAGTHRGILRFHADGKPDRAFRHGPGANNAIETVALQSDGRILIAGPFTHYNGEPRGRIARLNADGSLDASLAPAGGGASGGRVQRVGHFGLVDSTSIHALALEADGTIVIAGEFTTFNGTPTPHITRLLQDGSLDPTFHAGTGIPASGISSGRWFRPGGGDYRDRWVTQVRVARDGGLLVSGGFPSVNRVPRPFIVRLNGGPAPATAPQVRTQPSDLTLRSGQDLALDARFTGELPVTVQWYRNQEPIPAATNTQLTLKNLDPDSAGDYSCRIRNRLGETLFLAARLSVTPPVREPATVDTRFRVDLPPTTSVVSMDTLPDGSSLLVTTLQNGSFRSSYDVIHLAADGRTVRRFADVTRPFSNVGVSSAVLVQGGDVFAFGYFQDDVTGMTWNFLRIKPDGRIEPGFDDALVLSHSTVLRLRSGKLLLVTYNGGQTLTRLNADGSIDPTFKSGVQLLGDISAIAEEASGSLLVGGSCGPSGTEPAGFCLFRLTSEGLPHPSSLKLASTDGPITGIGTRSDGSIIVSGSFSTVGDVYRPYLARLRPDGTLDPEFPKTDLAELFTLVPSIVVLPDDGVVGGGFVPTSLVFRLFRVTRDGEVDLNFDHSGVIPSVRPTGRGNRTAQLRLTPTGKLLVFGSFAEVDGLPRQSIARLHLENQPRVGLIPGPNRLVWDEGQLEQTDALGGPWQPVPNAASPLPLAPSQSTRFYRLRLPE